MRKCIVVMLCVLIGLLGCNAPWGLPGPTSRQVPVEGIAGIWQFQNATLHLYRDSTFELRGSKGYDGTGTWLISGTKKELTLTYSDRPESIIIGYIIDSKAGDFGIFGGDSGDPDYWKVMTKVE